MHVTESSSVTCLSQEVLLAGFRDCMDEAVRYLTEVEQLPQNAPVLNGLMDHLEMKEQDLAPATTECTPTQTSSTGVPNSTTYPVYRIQQIGGQQFLVLDQGLNVRMDQGGAELTSLDNNAPMTTCAGHVSDVPQIVDLESVTIDNNVRYHPATDIAVESPPMVEVTTGKTSSDDDVIDGATELSLLAKANPQIDSLLAELFDLLEEDDLSSDEEDMDIF